MNRLNRWALVFLLGVTLTGIPACTPKASSPGGMSVAGSGKGGPAPVKVASVTQRNVPVQLGNFGNVEARNTVSVKAQISGEITQVLFKEGDSVTKGQVLFQIDPRPYEVALAQAQATLSKSKALADQARASADRSRIQAENAKKVFERDADLLPKKMVSQEEYEGGRATAEGAKASVAADEASAKSAIESIRLAETAIDDAKLKLEYCTIKSPLDGRTGNVLMKAGNIVKANDTAAMVTINEVAPIYVTFTLPEKQLPIVRASQAKGPVEVQALIPTEEDRPVNGHLVFIDNEVSDTHTILLKAEFDNADSRLWPGQYVKVQIQVDVLLNALVVPTQAIQTGQDGSFVYVVQPAPEVAPKGGAQEGSKPDSSKTDAKPSENKGPALIVVMRPVVPGETVDGFTAVKEGLKVGEQVVTDGQLRCVPDGPVRIVTGKDGMDAKPSADSESKPADKPVDKPGVK